MKLSVIIPVYNEKDTIVEIINRIKSVPIEKEIIVVDDGSTDGTRKKISNINPPKADQISNIKVIYHNDNRGKGSAIRTGLQYVTGDVMVIQDADLEYKPQEYLNLLKPIKEGKTSVTYGSRFKGDGKFIPLSFIANKILTFITNLLYFSRLTDMETCYKCIKMDVINSLDITAKRFDFEPEVTAKLLRKGYKILEIPISYKGRIKKKIGARDGIQAIFTLIKWKFR
ncbi:glycosyltransferase family 2 protein [candidate division WOR-3 bacterium]|nr:glycosyltransferase family 2 protein [candidate division WOR-3 bacterium]